jgi:hypothetical protein
MATNELLKKLSSPRQEIQPLETLNGQRIQPLLPAQLDYRNGYRGSQECYRLCQILPVVPQRLEWINVKNIREVKA